MRASLAACCCLLALGRASAALTSPTQSGSPRAWRPANLEHWDRGAQPAESSSGSTASEVAAAVGSLYEGVSIDNLLERQHRERTGTQWQWEKNARVTSNLFRHASVLAAGSRRGRSGGVSQRSLIEVASSRAALPASQAKRMRESIAKKLTASPAAKVATRRNSVDSGRSNKKKQSADAVSASSSIVAPKWEHQKARFSEVGRAGASARAGAGADPWWLNPPPWWLPPPPEWGSPPPSVYSPFYSPASIQQPFYNSPSHNSYPAYTPKPAPYRFVEMNELSKRSAYRAKRPSSNPTRLTPMAPKDTI